MLTIGSVVSVSRDLDEGLWMTGGARPIWAGWAMPAELPEAWRTRPFTVREARAAGLRYDEVRRAGAARPDLGGAVPRRAGQTWPPGQPPSREGYLATSPSPT